MPLIDGEGRLLGRVNLVDAIVVVAIVGLLPLAYAAALLFRPSQPQITSVEKAAIDNSDRRLARGTLLSAKLKVRGSGLTPMLRATVGTTPALAFVFEHPNSADVLVGAMPAGAHDLVLFDGVQEVARATNAVVIESLANQFVRAAGWIAGTPTVVAETIKPGYRFPEKDHAFEVVALGTVVPGTSRISFAGRDTDLRRADAVQRRALINLRCDPPVPDIPCSVGGVLLAGSDAVGVDLPAPGGSFRFVVEEVFPPTAPVRGVVSIVVAGEPSVDINAREPLLDERAAKIVDRSRAGGGTLLTIELGMDPGRDGWRYRGRLLKVGGEFAFTTDALELKGQIRSITPAHSSDRSQ
jgi:hypothetical protein